MATTIAYRPCGLPTGLSVAGSSHAAVAVNATDASAQYLLLHNTSATLILYVTLGATTAATPAATIPGDGTTGSFPILPNSSVCVPAPFQNNACALTAIGSGAGPTLLIATPVSSL